MALAVDNVFNRIKPATFLLPLLLLVAAAVARPAVPEALTGADAAQEPELHPPSLQEVVHPVEERALVRERRWAGEKQRGSVSASVHREHGVGTVVQAQGQGNIWSNNNGNVLLDALGQWSQVVDGSGRGKPNYNSSISFNADFPQRGSVSGSVALQKGEGFVVKAEGQGNLWTSKNGNVGLDAYGGVNKVLD